MRHSHLLAAIAAIAAPIAIVAPAQAGTVRSYNAAEFNALQAQGKPVLIFVHAPWCPVCRAQTKTIDEVLQDPAYRDLTVMKIDFDTGKADWQRFGATQQSTLIGFHGRRETSRLAHDTDPAKVKAVLASTLR
ncbi:thioredoxin family protein [Sphingomonas sp.]|uniref:thioredoxin family protein n=1 Tax=Sphingomonas sp. TaxID=28214 RepID=UPI001DDC71A0|nr:thioredoxin family protein [Sphingomonas sp.]MBX9796797.1 thioredoxin family protein [Sphingomonas sp.]